MDWWHGALVVVVIYLGVDTVRQAVRIALLRSQIKDQDLHIADLEGNADFLKLRIRQYREATYFLAYHCGRRRMPEVSYADDTIALWLRFGELEETSEASPLSIDDFDMTPVVKTHIDSEGDELHRIEHPSNYDETLKKAKAVLELLD